MKALDAVLSSVENGVAALAFALITGVAFVNVISRYFLDASLAFTTEITINVAVWLTMIGAVIGVRESSHLGFSLLHEKLEGRAKDVLTVVIGAAMAIFFAVLLWYGWSLASSQMENGRATPSMQVPQWLFSIALPVGAALGILRTLQVTIRSLRREESTGPTQGRAIA